MSALQARLHDVAAAFVTNILAAVRAASIAEMFEGTSAATLPGDARGTRPPGASTRVGARSAPGPRSRRRVTHLPKSSGRRSAEHVTRLQGQLVEVIRNARGGMAISEVAKSLNLTPGDLTRPIALAVKANLIRKTGKKRGTRYFSRRG